LVLDHSGSMKPPASDTDTTSKIAALHEAGFRFVDSMSSTGRASILPFSTTVGTPRPFWKKTQATDLRANIKKLTPFGETALFDATYEAISLLEADGARGKRAVVAMTDGIDNTSRRRVEEVIERATNAKIPLYMLGFGRDGEIDDATMKKLAKASGGKYYHAKTKDDLVEIFENLSIQLHDDGIDEATLKLLSSETGGQYFPAKNVTELKFILEQVTKNIQRESYEIVFPSLNQRADGAVREVTLKLVQRVDGADTVLGEVAGSYQMRGLVVAEMHPGVYLLLLLVIGGLIALPALLRRSTTTS
jgi:VWFA-related protein